MNSVSTHTTTSKVAVPAIGAVAAVSAGIAAAQNMLSKPPALETEQRIEQPASQKQPSNKEEINAGNAFVEILGDSKKMEKTSYAVEVSESSEYEQILASDSPKVKKAKVFKNEMLDSGGYIDSRGRFLCDYDLEGLDLSYWINEVEYWDAYQSKRHQ